MEEEPSDPPRCDKCDRKFSDKKALQDHLTRRYKSCIGIWYVCKRCNGFFDTPSAISRHQGLKTACEAATVPSGGAETREAALAIRLQKGIDDAGSIQNYLAHVVEREDEQEIADVLESCLMEHAELLLKMIGEIEYMGRKINLLAILADYANGETVSPERGAIIREFVDVHVTL